jgi:hypothetical protein
VLKYVNKFVIPEKEKEDVIMAIAEKFINQQDRIIDSFEGRSKESTFIIAVVNRMCCEIIRRESKHWYSVSNDGDEHLSHSFSTLTYDTERALVIGNELKRFQNVMLLFNSQQCKINLFLKFYFDVAFSDDEIKNYALNKYSEVAPILSRESNMQKSEVFERLALVQNIVEGKVVKGDAVRMWLNKQINSILLRLNGNGLAEHSDESIATMLEMVNS